MESAAPVGSSEHADVRSALRRATGVLFDIDDTLVNLEAAMGATLRDVSSVLLGGLSDEDWDDYTRIFARDPEDYYGRFLAGDMSFAGQRLERMRHAHRSMGGTAIDDQAAEQWTRAYEATLPLHFMPFPDVVPLLDALDRQRIPYGAVSNNTHDYQRAKLNTAGLRRIEVLVAIDTAGVAKPDPAIFLEGTQRLGTNPQTTLYIGDNPAIDAAGADAAGLVGMWLDRRNDDAAEEVRAFTGRRITTLAAVLSSG